MVTNYISLTTEAQLAVAAAEQRLARARSMLADFLLRHLGGPSPELQSAWEHEKNLLVIEVDEAQRFLRKCRTDLAELRAEK